MKRAVFIDKDRSLIQSETYAVDPAEVVFTPHALEGLRLLREHGYEIVIIANQPGLAMGYFDDEALARLERHVAKQCRAAGAEIAGFYACPHRALASACRCRQPQPGLILRAAAELGISLDDSWMVGDILNDIEAGRRAGCRTVFMDLGRETEWRTSLLRAPYLKAKTLLGAAQQILSASLSAPDRPIARVPSGSDRLRR